MGPSSCGKGQAAMLRAPNRHVLPWQDTQTMQDTCRGMLQLGLKMSLCKVMALDVLMGGRHSRVLTGTGQDSTGSQSVGSNRALREAREEPEER